MPVGNRVGDDVFVAYGGVGLSVGNLVGDNVGIPVGNRVGDDVSVV